jgi:hypothetical protein
MHEGHNMFTDNARNQRAQNEYGNHYRPSIEKIDVVLLIE